MKASEIQTNGIYLHNPSADWRFQNWNTSRVRVVDAVPGYWTYDRVSKQYVKSTYGNGYSSKKGILVERLLEDADKVTERRVVTIGHLRGNWDECRAVQISAQAAAKQRADEENAKRNAVLVLVDDTVEFAKRLLGNLKPFIGRSQHGDKVLVDPVLFRAMAMELHKQGWKYEA